RLHMGDKAADELWCVAIGPRLVVGGAGSKVEDFAARADKKLAGLAKGETFQKQVAALDKTSGTPVLWFAVGRSIQEIFAKVQDAEDAGMKFLNELPSDLNPLGSARVARMQFVGERFVTEMVSAEPAGTPASKALDPTWLEPVPSGSMFVYAGAFDGAEAGKRLRALLAKDEQSAATLAALEQKLGFGPERVLAHLGPGLTVYAAPPSGPGVPDTRAWVDCDDPAAFTKEFEALVGAMGETLPGFSAKSKTYTLKKRGSDEKVEVAVESLKFPQEMQIPMVPLTPSFATVGKKLVFALNATDVRSELKRVHTGEGEPIVAGGHPLSSYGFEVPAGVRS